MISNIAPKSTDAAGSATSTAAESADTGDTGAFDALLSVVGEATVTDLGAQLAGELEGVDLPGSLDDSDDSLTEDDTLPDDALSFLAAILPLTAKPVASADPAGGSAATSVQADAVSAGAGGVAAASTGDNGTAGDLAQAILLGTDTDAPESKAAFTMSATNTTHVVDTKSLNALSAPAEMFAHAPRHVVAERADSSPMTTHVRDPRWADDLGNRLASMVRTGESSASLQLTPVDLGPLEVKVAVRDNQATVHFGATNAETRALLEASIPRLREMLAAQGFQLMDSSVSHGFARPTRHESAGTPRVDEVGESPSVVAQTHITGLLDLYA